MKNCLHNKNIYLLTYCMLCLKQIGNVQPLEKEMFSSMYLSIIENQMLWCCLKWQHPKTLASNAVKFILIMKEVSWTIYVNDNIYNFIYVNLFRVCICGLDCFLLLVWKVISFLPRSRIYEVAGWWLWSLWYVQVTKCCRSIDTNVDLIHSSQETLHVAYASLWLRHSVKWNAVITDIMKKAM